MKSIPTLPADISHPREPLSVSVNPVNDSGLMSPTGTPKRLRRRSHSPTPSVVVPESSVGKSDKKSTSSEGSGLAVDRLPTDKYESIILKVEEQIRGIIGQALFLQKRGLLIERIVFSESITFLVVNSVSNLIGAAKMDDSTKIIFMYIFFSLGIVFSCIGLFVKWLKSRQDRDIDNYRNILKELVHHYEQDAWFAVERERMSLPPEVLSQGFFRGITKEGK